MFSLEKQVQRARFILEKKGIPDVKAAVVLNIDVSGSTQNLFKSGKIQKAFENIVPLAINFDDNQSLQVFTFASGSKYVSEISPDATSDNYSNYIQKNILENSNVPKWGGTDYAPVLRANLENLGYYSKKSKGFFGLGGAASQLKKNNDSGFPSFVITITDGINSDQSEVIDFLSECETAGVQAYFLFIGIGDAHEFNHIIDLGEKFSNVGFVSVDDIDKFTGSDEVYDLLLPEELVTWFSKK